MPAKDWTAEDLRSFANTTIISQCEEYARRLVQEKLLPAAKSGDFVASIGSEEIIQLRNKVYRNALIKILEKRGFEVTESNDRDEYYITISWAKKE